MEVEKKESEKKEVMKEHLSAMITYYNENLACRLFRSHAQYYTEGWPHATRLRGQLMLLSSYAQLVDILKSHLETVSQE